MANTMTPKLAKFDDNDCGVVTVANSTGEQQEVGYVERVKDERFASASSRARISFVSHYLVCLDAQSSDDWAKEFKTLPEVRAYLKTIAATTNLIK